MAKNRVIHARLDDTTHDQLFEKCNELGCSFTEYITDVVRSSLEDDKSDLEPKIFDCKDGNLFHDDNLFGKCADFKLNAGKVYDSFGNYLGQTRDSLKPTVTSIE